MTRPALAVRHAASPLGALLRELGVTRPAFAAAVGVDARSVERWVSGTRPRGLSLRSVAAWLEARGRTFDDAFPPEAALADKPTPFPRPSLAPAPDSPNPPEPPVEITPFEYLDDATLTHFGLRADPFDPPETPEDLWLSPVVQRVESTLLAAMKRRQMVALVGPAGSGKSSIVRRLYGRMAGQKRVRMVAPASLDRRRITSAALSVAILRDLTGHETSGLSMERRSDLLRSALEDAGRNGIAPVLLIDEAHLLPDAALIAIKQVWDSHTLWQQITVILVGQPELARRLRQEAGLREVTGRTSILEIPRMTGESVADYLRWRFARVGGDADIVFDPAACKALAVRGEHPLWVNNLAIRAMSCAAAVGDERVGGLHVGKV